jgi:peptidoglycan/LPS O-acetylase OafA/YrhL
MESTDGMKIAFPRHFYSLDALRGVAALAVVFWHWQHFSYQGTQVTQFNQERAPLYGIFKPLYTDGWRAVELFFCLSGFIFFWLYSERISRGESSLREFAVLRLSRLYPLHLLTLLLVAAGQHFMLWRYGSFFVYPYNDLYHFGLQAAFASNWGLERGDSFNGPIWSVSVEILLYAAFFVVCVFNLRQWWHLGIFICGGYLVMRLANPDVGRGLFAFFIGGLSFQSFSYIWRRCPSRIALQCLGAFTSLMWIFIPLNNHHSIIYRVYRHFLWNEGLNVYGRDLAGFVLLKVSHFSFETVLFPLTIVTLALWEARRGTLCKRLGVLGHLSYSSYLLHFPLQLMFAAVAFAFAAQRTLFCAPRTLLLFFVILIPLSLCSYHFLERPCQSLLRAWLLRGSVNHTRRV